MTDNTPPEPSVVKTILAVVVFTLFCYCVIGLQMAVTPLFVREKLGFNSAIAGFAVSVQYLATFATRAGAGHRIDHKGPKYVVLVGLYAGIACGVLIAASAYLTRWPVLALLCVLAGRITLGFAESWVATAVIVWNIRRVGAAHTAQVISWNGVCSYGGIALGAPIATVLYQAGGTSVLTGFSGVGLLCAALMAIGLPLALKQPAVAPLPASQLVSFMQTLNKVWPFGMALAAGSVGFGAISALLTLYFSDQHWGGAALALTLFGTVFVLTRFGFTRQIMRRGGVNVAFISLFVEALGLMVLAYAPTAFWACVGAALSGAGFSLLFPALGVGAVERVGPENRGAAIGAFCVFLDIAIGVSGPLLGLIIPLWGYGVLFGITALCAVIGMAMCYALNTQKGLKT
ncbi:MAG: MFS transporter [Acetobacter orientalis]|uniref:MFS transporter n=1 Tax=Acetobacter orientalis TaxID=146474 RepID=UPI0039EB9D03